MHSKRMLSCGWTQTIRAQFSHVFSHSIRAQFSHKTESTFCCVEVIKWRHLVLKSPLPYFSSCMSLLLFWSCLSLGCVEVASSVTLTPSSAICNRLKLLPLSQWPIQLIHSCESNFGPLFSLWLISDKLIHFLIHSALM